MVPNATILQLMQLYSQILVSGQMQLYCNLCNYMQLYCNLCNYIMQQFRMQLYATMQLCNMQLTQLYATICNYMQLVWQFQLYATL
jgi:hypothetical protein